MENILLQPYEIWDYFEENRESLLDTPEMIAGNDATRAKIYISADYLASVSEHSKLTISVVEDDDVVDEVTVDNGVDCAIEATELFKFWLVPEHAFGEDPFDEAWDRELEMDDRENELSEAVDDLLWVFCQKEDFAKLRDEIDEIKDHICEYLFTEFGADIYRPMYLETESGEEVFYEFPYSEMELGED